MNRAVKKPAIVVNRVVTQQQTTRASTIRRPTGIPVKSKTVPNSAPVRVCLRGLKEDAWYETEDGRRFLGAALLYQGITLPLRGDFDSFVCVLKSV